MPRLACLLGLLVAGTSLAAPVPKEKPDPLPDGALVRLGSARFRGPNTDGVTFGNDGKTLYATDGKTSVFRWDAATGKPLKPIELDLKGIVCSWMAEDRVFLLRPVRQEGGEDKTFDVVVHDLLTQKHVTFSTKFGANVSYPWSEWFRASAGGRWLAGVNSESNEILVYGTADGELTVKWGKEFKSRPAVSDDGKMVIGLRGGNLVRLDTTGEGAESGMTAPVAVSRFDVTPDWKTVVGVGTEGRAKSTDPFPSWLWVWDVDGEEPRNQFGIPGEVSYLQVLGGSSVLTVEYDRTQPGESLLCRRELADGKRTWASELPFRFKPTISSSPDGKRIVVSNGESILALFDATTGKRLDETATPDDALRWVGYSTDGKTVTTATWREIRTWRPDTGELLATHRPTRSGSFLTAMGGVLVWEDQEHEGTTEYLGWSLSAGKVLWRFTQPSGRDVWCRPASDRLVFWIRHDEGQADEAVVMDERGKEVVRWPLPDDYRAGLLQSDFRIGNDVLLVSPTRQKDLQWEWLRVSLKDGSVVDRYPLEKSSALLMALTASKSPDAKQIVAKGSAGLTVLNASDGSVKRSVTLAEGYGGPKAFSPDSKRVLAAFSDSPTVQLASLTGSDKPRSFTGNTHVTTAAFSPDGKRAVVGYRDGTALIWDVSR